MVISKVKIEKDELHSLSLLPITKSCSQPHVFIATISGSWFVLANHIFPH